MIDLDKLSTADLARLLASASSELNRRLSSPAEIDVPAADLPPVAIEHSPPLEDQDFVEYVKAIARNGEYVKAAVRQRIALIAEQYPHWMNRQGIPLTAGTGEWRKLAEDIRRMQRRG